MARHIHDVLIIGAGPAGLAVAARLAEPTPSALFTDEEHRRYCWINGRRAARLQRRTGKSRPARADISAQRPSISSSSEREVQVGAQVGGYDMLVLDGEGAGWLARWKRLFAAYGIAFLRSPLFFHVDPADRDALLRFAYERGRQDEMAEIVGVVGKELSKHKRKQKRKGGGLSGTAGRKVVDERDREDYYVPGRQLFEDHCDEVIRRYGLDAPGLIQREIVTDIEMGQVEDGVLTVKTRKGEHHARVVVLASGPPGLPSSPDTIPVPRATEWPEGSFTHSYHVKEFPTSAVEKRIRRRQHTHVAVVGGGLTAAQLVDLALRRGVSHVSMLIRGRSVKVKPFDVDLEWIGKFKNTEKARFWTAEDEEERLEMIRAARGGGSVTPTYSKYLKKWEEAGRLTMHTETYVVGLRPWVDCPDRLRRDSGYLSGDEGDDKTERRWVMETEPAIEGLLPVDHVYFATGGAGMPCKDKADMCPQMLKGLQHKHAMEWLRAGTAAVPVLTTNLAWSEDVPLYVTGAMAALELGPGAGNLEGARVGAERCAWAIEERLEVSDSKKEWYQIGYGGRFEGLSLAADE